MKLLHWILITVSFKTISAIACSISPPPGYIIKSGSLYFGGGYGEMKDFKLISKGGNKIKIINTLYALDDKYVYYRGERIAHAKPETFNFIGGLSPFGVVDGYSKDDNHVFFQGKIVPFADAKSFILVSNKYKNTPVYASDINHIYSEGRIINQLKPAFAKKISKLSPNPYWVVGSKLFYHEKIGDSDYLTLLENNFMGNSEWKRDYLVTKGGVYKNGKKMPYDPVTFTALVEQNIGGSCQPSIVAVLVGDKFGTYLSDKKIAPPLTKTRSSHIFKDKKENLYVYANNNGLRNLGAAKDFFIFNVNDSSLILGKIINFYFDKNDLLELAEEDGIPDGDKLNLYIPMNDSILLSSKNSMFIFNGVLSPINFDSKSRMVYFDDDIVVFVTAENKMQVIERGGVSEKYTGDDLIRTDIKYIRPNHRLSFLMRNRHDLDKDSGMLMIQNFLTYIDGSVAIPISDKDYLQLMTYAISDEKWEEIRKQKVKEYLMNNTSF